MERLALEFLFVLAFVLVLFELAEPVGWVVLARRCANVGFDRAHLDGTEQHKQLNELKLIHIARRLRIDRSRHVRRRTFRRQLIPHAE